MTESFIPSVRPEILGGKTASPDTFVFVFQGRSMLVLERGGEIRLPRLSDFPDAESLSGLYVGRIDGTPCIGADLPGRTPEGSVLREARNVLDSIGEPACCAGCRAKELLFWRSRMEFCGACAAPLADSPDDVARVCPKCGARYYPQLAPAVITAVVRSGRILLAHNRNFHPKIFSLIAGFVEAGETLEQAVRREIREETGIAVRNLRYHSSQSWPFPNSLMAGFTAEYASGEMKPDGVELEEAGWFAPGELPPLPDRGSIARRIIEDFRAGKF